jgi:hypothetical protein
MHHSTERSQLLYSHYTRFFVFQAYDFALNITSYVYFLSWPFAHENLHLDLDPITLLQAVLTSLFCHHRTCNIYEH